MAVVNHLVNTVQNPMVSDKEPDILWGTGSPDGDYDLFKDAQKGTLYIQADATDDGTHIWQKVDEGGDDADWKPLVRNYWQSKEFNIDNGNGTTDDDVWSPQRAILVTAVRAVYTEASDSSMGAATFKVGSAVGGAQVVAATTLEESKSVGTYTDGVIVAGAIAANGILAVRHTGIAATQVGKYRLYVEYH